LNRACRLVSVLAAGCLAGLFFRVHGTQVPALKPSPPLQNLGVFLPKAGDLQGWKPEKAPQVYKGEDLYLYIDGGAEIYREYGFKQVLVQDYKSAAGKSLTLEIFEMADSPGAFGIYTFKSSGKGKTVAPGQDGQLEDYYLNFWKDNLLVTLTGFDESPDVIQGLMLIAKSVDAKIRTRGARPSLVGVFPKEWQPIGRLKYIKGVLGLNNIRSFFARDVFQFKEGVTAVIDSEKLSIFVFRYSSPEECRRRFQEVKTAFEKDPAYKYFRNIQADLFRVQDSQGTAIFGQPFADCIALILTKENEASATTVLTSLRNNWARII
jgi:Family of unknown function (DUF6599)